MIYGSSNLLEQPISITNESGQILFKISSGIEFHVVELSNDFFVTVPAFGGQMRTTQGKCTVIQGRKFRFDLTQLSGTSFVFSSTHPNNVFIHLLDDESGERLSCNVDIDVQRFEVIDDSGHLVLSVRPDCRTNLGGILSAFFKLPVAGEFTLKAIPSLGNFEASTQRITVF